MKRDNSRRSELEDQISVLRGAIESRDKIIDRQDKLLETMLDAIETRDKILESQRLAIRAFFGQVRP